MGESLARYASTLAGLVAGSSIAVAFQAALQGDGEVVGFATLGGLSVILVLWRLVAQAYDKRESIRQDALKDTRADNDRLRAEVETLRAERELYRERWEMERAKAISLEQMGLLDRRHPLTEEEG